MKRTSFSPIRSRHVITLDLPAPLPTPPRRPPTRPLFPVEKRALALAGWLQVIDTAARDSRAAEGSDIAA